MQKSSPEGRTETAAGARGRGRPRAFDREAALEKATRLFWAKGYEATSMADLTSAMGIGSPSLYAAFGSKEALYEQALRYYSENFESLYWANFETAATAREAMAALLMDSARAMSTCPNGIPHGCMVTLSSVASEGHEHLGALVHSARAVGLQRLKARIEQDVAQGKLPATIDVHALARFVQAVQNGMSTLARDGASRAELEDIARSAMLAWDARVGGHDAGQDISRA